MITIKIPDGHPFYIRIDVDGQPIVVDSIAGELNAHESTLVFTIPVDANGNPIRANAITKLGPIKSVSAAELHHMIANPIVPPANHTNRVMTDGSPITPDHAEIDSKTGMQKGYVVLSEEERAKGFVRPVRNTYVHVGPSPPQYPLRDLTEDEKTSCGNEGYVKFEVYPDSEAPLTGHFWTQAQLDNHGCGVTTTMGQAIAETYARDNKFYGATFCCGCGRHLPVEEFVWDGTDERVGS